MTKENLKKILAQIDAFLKESGIPIDQIKEFRGGLLKEQKDKDRKLLASDIAREIAPLVKGVDTEALRKIIEDLRGRKFLLDCGHRVTFGHSLGNSVTIYKGKVPTIICSLCGH